MVNKAMRGGGSLLCRLAWSAGIASILLSAITCFAAPLNGLESVYKQPDGTVLKLKFYGDEFYARTETEDGYTVVFDPASKTYFYADVSTDGNEFVSTGKKPGKDDPAALGLKKSLKISGKSRAAKSTKRAKEYEAVVKQMKRWESVKAASREYRKFKKELKEKEKAGKKGFAIPMGTILPEDEAPSGPQMADGDKTKEGEPPIAQAPPSFTLTGDVVGLTILVDFSDDPGTVVTQAQVDDYCNKPNYTGFGNAGSVYDYFYIQSGSNLRYNNNVTYYVRVPQPKTYYNDTAQDSGICGRLLLNDALNVLLADGYDFSPLTTKAGGNIRCCNIFFAGNDSGVWSKGLWPHRWVLSPKKDVGGGKFIYDYQITNIGTTPTLKIGTFCHENGHMMLGYPDLYAYNGNAANVGNFSLMASGNYGGSGYHPTHIDPYLKTASGWTDIIELNSSSHQRCTVQVDGNQFYRYLNPGESREYFMFEVRDNTGYEGPYGGHASAVNPATGLLVWHFREHGQNTYSTIMTADNPGCDYTTPFEALLLEANPSTTKVPWYDDPTPGNNDAFKSTDKNQITEATTPALKFWDATGRNTASGANVHSISIDGSTMTFVIGAGAPTGSPVITLSKSTIDSTCDFGTNAGAESFAIGNGGGGTLSYTVSDNQTWLSCTPTTGTATTESDTIAVNFSSSGLSAGSYVATITVTDPAASPTTDTITVNLTVNPAPILALSTNSLSVTAFSGGAGPQIDLDLDNIGGGELTYTLTKTNSWLTLSSTSGSLVQETDTIYINFDASALSTGVYYDAITITSPEASNSPQVIPVELTVLDGPVASVTPTNLTMYAATGGVDSASVSISNTGGSPLNYTITDDLPSATSYTVLDSDAGGGPTYSWIDISALGSAVALTDDGTSGFYSIGFTFPFYGTPYTQFQIGANGVVSFSSGTVAAGNAALPSASIPSQSLAAFWDDLNPASGGQVRYHSNASRLVVSWLAVPRYGTTDNETFQIIIYPDGRIVYQYQTLAGVLNSCTVGIQDNNSSGPSEQTAFNTTYIKNAFAVEYAPPAEPWLTYPVSSGSVVDGTSSSVWFYASASNLTEGVYTALVSIAMNDINNPLQIVPVVFNVSSVPVPRVDVSKSTVAVTEGGANDTYTLVLGTAPSNDVVITLSPGIELGVDKTNVTFTSGDWDQPQTITVSAIDDGDHELAHSGTITHSAASSDPGYNGISINSVNANITDNDNTPPTVNAGPDQEVFLGGVPAGDPVAGADILLDAGMDDGANSTWEDSLGLWNVTINAGVNFVTDAGSALTGITSAYDFPGGGLGTNGCYGPALQDMGVDTQPITLEIWFKPDQSGSYPANGQVLWETGGGTGLGIFYNNGMVEAAHDSNAGQISADVSALTNEFIQAVVTYDPTGSVSNFNLYINGELAATGSRSDTDMCGGDDSGLGQRGQSNVGGAGNGDSSTESFDGKIAIFRAYHNQVLNAEGVTSNYNSVAGSGVTVFLDGTVNDADGDPVTSLWSVVSGPAPVTIANPSAVDTTAVFTAVGVYTLRLTVDDTMAQTNDECIITVSEGGAGVLLTQSGGNTAVTEGGATDSYTIKLNSEPTAGVTINLATNGQVSVSPATLAFSTVNWSNAQVVTVTAIDDLIDEGAHTGTISHAVSSADSNYNGIAVNNVIPAITDNDAPGTISLASATYNVNENGGSVTLTVNRSGGDAGAVSIDISTSNGTALAGFDYTANSQTLSWADRNSDSKSFIVAVTDNGVYSGDRGFSVIMTNLVGSAGLGITSAAVTITEDEPEPIGARVVSQSPSAGVGQSPGVSQVSLTFSEVIDTNSFSIAEDISSFTGGQGVDLLSTINGHSWSNGNTELVVTFDPLTNGASYRMVLGPGILTTNAFPMDQDNDSALGEVEEDVYAANILVLSGGTNLTLWSDLLGSDDTPDPAWTLGAGWQVGVPTEDGVSGPNADTDAGTQIVAQNLAGNYTAGSSTYGETPDIDASAFTNVWLDFQEWKGLGKNDTMYVDVGSGTNWTRVYTNTGPNGGANDGGWGAHNVNISAGSTGRVFRIRWGLDDVTSGGSGVETGWQLDALKVSGDSPSAGAPPLPAVVSHSPTGSIEGSVSSLYLGFSQPMDTNSFAIGSDIASFTGPSTSITATAFSWVSDTLLRVDYPLQTADGTYTMVLNPSILDGWGQLIDQDKDSTGGEAVQDQYSASFSINNANFIPAPTGLAAAAVSSSQVDLTWTDTSTNETGFAVNRSLTSGSGFSVIGSAAADATNYSDSTVSPGVTYYYTVTATNATDSSTDSAEASAVTPKLPATVTLSNTNQTYNGTPRVVSATTSPTGLTVNITYNGSGTAPTVVGSYAVVGTISDPTYQGNTNGTLLVSKATPNVTAWPTASSITYGQALSSSALSGGTSSVPGTFSFDSPATTPDVGIYGAAVTFTPTDSTNYNSVTGGTVNVTVGKATPTVTTWPTAAGITYGQAVSNATLSGGSASVPGTFSYDSPAVVPVAGTYSAAVTFTPDDTTRYLTVAGSVNIAVAKAPATVTLSDLSHTYDGTGKVATVTTSPTNLTVDVTYNGTAAVPTNAGSYSVLAVVNETNYQGNASNTLVIAQAATTVTTWPTAAAITEGQAISNATLSGGSASVSGAFTYDAPATTPPQGVYTADVTFTPTDSVNYESVTGTVDVTVNEAPPAAPTGLNAVALVGQVDLSWNASPTADSYNVKRSSVPGGPYTTIGTPTPTNYSDTTVVDGSNYYYVVSAVNTGGESSNSGEASVTMDYFIPFTENFESLGVGDLGGQNGWIASNAAVQTSVALDVQAGSVTTDTGFVKHNFSGNDTNVWTDMQIQPVFAPEDLVPEANTTAAIFFNTNGNPVVYDGTNKVVLSGISVSSSNWVQVTIHSDYAAKTWDLYIDGALATNGLGFYDAAQAKYSSLTVKGGAEADPAFLDDVSISTISPFGALLNLTVFSAHGVATPSGSSSSFSNTLINAYLSGSPIISGSTQYVCTGWTGTGSATNGSGTNTSFTITSDTTITWQWQTNYWIDLDTIGN